MEIQNKTKHSLIGLFTGLIFASIIICLQAFLSSVKFLQLPAEALKSILRGLVTLIAPLTVVLPSPLFFLIYCTIVGLVIGRISTRREYRKKLISILISLLVVQWILLIVGDINLSHAIRKLVESFY